jgi:hypothetical protein
LTGWVNRFANAGDAAMEVAGNTALRVRSFYSLCFSESAEIMFYLSIVYAN